MNRGGASGSRAGQAGYFVLPISVLAATCVLASMMYWTNSRVLLKSWGSAGWRTEKAGFGGNDEFNIAVTIKVAHRERTLQAGGDEVVAQDRAYALN